MIRHIKIGICLLLLLGGMTNLCAQTVLSGKVSNKSGEPLQANISVRAVGSSLIKGFTVTNGKGEFALRYTGKEDSLVLVVSGMLIGKHERKVRNVTQRLDISIEEKTFKLKEVAVKAMKIRRDNDTLNYLVNAFAGQDDRVIGDVLKKMPGIEVSDNGNISFNGKPINKFYVEEMDLLQGRYGLATNNIPAKAVSVVQVLENHQPVKVLQDKIPTDAVAINLKLKEEAKGVLTGAGMAGGGYQPWLWNAELTGMLFGKKYQTISVYKGNNTGDDVQSEFRSHYGGGRLNAATGSMLRVQSPSMPNVSSKRYARNHSHAVSTNHLKKLKNSGEWSTGVMYYNDRIDKEGNSLTEQYLPSGEKLIIDESVESTNHIHNLEVSSRLNINDRKKYINDMVSLKMNWNRDTGTGTVLSNANHEKEVVNQHLDRPLLAVGNTFNMIKEAGKSTYQLHFSAGYSEQPHTLSVYPVDYWEELSVNSLDQDLLLRNITADLNLSYGLKLGDFFLNYALWGEGDIQNLDTELTNDEPEHASFFADDSWRNNLWYNTWQVGLLQNYTFKKNDVRISLSVPLSYYRLSANDKIRSDKKIYNKPLFTPSLSLNYDYNDFKFNVQGRYSKSFGDINSAYSGYIMQGYRYLMRNEMNQLSENKQARFTGFVSYNNAFTALFFNVGGGYQRGWSNLLYGYDYSGIMRIKQTLEHPTTSDLYSVNLGIGKGFDFWSSSFQLSGHYSKLNNKQLLQGEVLDFTSENISWGVKGNIQPATWMGMDYSCDWYWSQSYTPTNKSVFSTVKSTLQNLHIKFFPSSKITLNIGVEHQYTNLASTKNMVFGDFTVKWKHKGMDIELEGNNLFNQKKYMRVFYSGTSMYRYSCDLRPVNALVKIRYNFK